MSPYTVVAQFGKVFKVPLLTYTDGKLDDPPNPDYVDMYWCYYSHSEQYGIPGFCKKHPGKPILVVNGDAVSRMY